MLNVYSINNITLTSNYGWMEWRKVTLLNKGTWRELGVLLGFKSPGSWNAALLWLKSSLPSVTWAFPLCTPIISWAGGAQPNPSSSKRRGQQSPRCDRQWITCRPSDPARRAVPARGLVAFETLSLGDQPRKRGRELDKRLPQAGFVCGRCENQGPLGEREINLELSFKSFLLLAQASPSDICFNWGLLVGLR